MHFSRGVVQLKNGARLAAKAKGARKKNTTHKKVAASKKKYAGMKRGECANEAKYPCRTGDNDLMVMCGKACHNGL